MNYSKSHRWKFFFFPLIALAFILAAGFAVMTLWNAILPAVFVSVGKLTFVQAIGLFILCRILFGGFKGGMGRQGYAGGPWKRKMMNMSDEEREKFRAEWKQRCGPGTL